jgi:hypothetical protein
VGGKHRSQPRGDISPSVAHMGSLSMPATTEHTKIYRFELDRSARTFPVYARSNQVTPGPLAYGFTASSLRQRNHCATPLLCGRCQKVTRQTRYPKCNHLDITYLHVSVRYPATPSVDPSSNSSQHPRLRGHNCSHLLLTCHSTSLALLTHPS